jgi:site-specific DNA-methyltransferase (adenine-specific)
MSSATFFVGDVFDVLRTLPSDSVDLILTSPPFLALRSYLPDDHPDKDKEIGQEPTPAEFLDTMLALTAEWGRVLAPHGSLVVELGDSYSGAGGTGGDLSDKGKRTQVGRDRFVGSDDRDGWPLAKSLCGIPELYAFSLAYGRNLLTGAESLAGMWRVRNLVRWCRPNPPVGALGDKFRPATSTMTVACKSRTRWFDLDSVRTPHQNGVDPSTMGENGYSYRNPTERGSGTKPMPGNPAGAPPLDYWLVPPSRYKGSHYATWPPDLLVRPVLSMCPQRVCRVCGDPQRRDGGEWTDCGHDDYRRGVVLDPFAGSGTTLAVASGHGRDAIGIDLDARNADLARDRVGMFLNVVAA